MNNKFPFAPGVIDMPEKKDGWLPEAIAITLCIAAVIAVVGFAAGYWNLPGVLL